MINQQHNASIAKLLATENVEVIHGKFRTASFDPTNRILRLPVFKDMGKDVYDLMVGHEVGHALYTTAEDWEHGEEVEGLPASLLNIVEDIRIERMIQDRYPGLIRSFVRGYSQLFAGNFFGTNDRDISSYGFLDRLNIKSKMQEQFDVPFSDEEQDLYDRAQKVRTWDDVIAMSKEIKEFLDENQEEIKPEEDQYESVQVTDEDSDEANQELDSSEDQDTDSEGDEDLGQENESGESDEDSEDEEESSSTPEQDEQETDEEPSDSVGQDPFQSETDDTFRSNEENLNEEIADDMFFAHVLPHKVYKEKSIIGYKELLRTIKIDQTGINYREWMLHDNNYKTFLPSARKAVNHMVKEFEMRRSADRHARAKTSRKGTLNPNKIHTYKYNDEIFNQVTTLADGKNHGLMVFVDFSASMVDIFDGTIKNAIQLALFCRQVNIPFQIYGFTSKHWSSEESINYPGYDVIDPQFLTLYDIFNNKQKKSEFEIIADHLIRLTDWRDSHYSSKKYPRWQGSNQETIALGGTPLNHAMLMASGLIKEFKAQTKIQLMTTFVLTDGDSHAAPLIIENRNDLRPDRPRNTKYALKVEGKTYEVSGYYDRVTAGTAECYRILKELTGTQIIGFHMANNTNDAYKYASSLGGRWDYDLKDHIKYGYRKVGYTVISGETFGLGLDHLYLMKPVSGEDDEFEVNEDASKQQLKKQFGKFMKSKKTNRLVFTEFGKMVA